MTFATMSAPQAEVLSGTSIPPSISEVADELQVNNLSAMTRDLRGEVLILQQMAQEYGANTDDPDAAREAEDARTKAAGVLAIAERIESEIKNAKRDPRTGRQQISTSRVTSLDGELKDCRRVIAEEKAQLRAGHAEPTSYTSYATEPESKPLVTSVASYTRRVARSVVAPVTAVAAAVHTPTRAESLMMDAAQRLGRLEARARTVWQQAQTTLDETVQRVSTSEPYQRFVAMRTQVVDTVSAFIDNPKEHLVAAASSVKKTAKEVVHHYVMPAYKKVEHSVVEVAKYVDREAITPVIHAAKAAYDTAIEAKNATVAYVKKPWAEKVADVKQWAGEKKEQLAKMLPSGGEKAPPILAKEEKKPAVAPSAARQALSGLSDKALALAKRAVEGLTPSAMAKTMSAASITTISAPMVPDISSAIGTFLGAP